jgi:hypothetical protein
METKSKSKTKSAKKQLTGKFYSAPVDIDKEFVTVRLPADVAPYLDINGKKVFWVAVNGVVQISGAEPTIVIPTLNFNAQSFVPRKVA